MRKPRKEGCLVVQDLDEVVRILETQVEEIDADLVEVFKKIEQAHSDSEIPPSLRKKMEELMDSRKDLSDRVHELRCVMDQSWERIEKNATGMLSHITQSIKKISDELN